MAEQTFCGATIEIEIDGRTDELWCSLRFDHEEEHAARAYWANDDPPASLSGPGEQR